MNTEDLGNSYRGTRLSVLTSGEGRAFNRVIIGKIRRHYELKSRFQRLRDAGLLTLDEIADILNVHPQTIKTWRDYGLLLAVPVNDRNECLYPHPGQNSPVKRQGTKLSGRRLHTDVLLNRTDEVHYEA